MSNVRLPAEWEEQDAIMLTWPHHETAWSHCLAAIEAIFVEIAMHISQFEHIIIVCQNNDHKKHIISLLALNRNNKSRFHFYAIPSDDTWARDHGPICIFRDGDPEILDFTFNGWGGKYAAILDNRISRELHRLGAFADVPFKSLDFVLEGGSIESDGQGSLLITTQCILSKARNPGFKQQEIANLFKQELGAEHILWLHHGRLIGDDTDGHIDTLARFVDTETICYVVCTDRSDAHFDQLQKMETELKKIRTKQGRPYHLIPLPLPTAKYSTNHQRLPATYANFLIINGAVLVPTYNDKNDIPALESIKSAFPKRKIIGINCAQIIEQNGSLHCLTMHFPRGTVANG